MKEVARREKNVGRKINYVGFSEDQPQWGGTEDESDLGTSGYAMFSLVHEAASISSPLDVFLQGSRQTCAPKSIGIISGKAEDRACKGHIQSPCLLPPLSPPEVVTGVVKLITWIVQHRGSWSPQVWPVETQSTAFLQL